MTNLRTPTDVTAAAAALLYFTPDLTPAQWDALIAQAPEPKRHNIRDRLGRFVPASSAAQESVVK